MERGKYICFEGGDGTGKSTLARALYMRTDDAATIRFPSDGDVGQLIRSGLMGETKLDERAYLYLFAADGLNEEKNIDALLDDSRHVICDRHPTLSGRVFQPLHHPDAHIEAVYNSAAEDGISMPDHLFVLDIPVSDALERMASREKYKDVVFEKADPEYIAMLRVRYLQLAKRFGGTVLDGTLPTEELVELVLAQTGLS
jgi:dTMP kinase